MEIGRRKRNYFCLDSLGRSRTSISVDYCAEFRLGVARCIGSNSVVPLLCTLFNSGPLSVHACSLQASITTVARCVLGRLAHNVQKARLKLAGFDQHLGHVGEAHVDFQVRLCT